MEDMLQKSRSTFNIVETHASVFSSGNNLSTYRLYLIEESPRVRSVFFRSGRPSFACKRLPVSLYRIQTPWIYYYIRECEKTGAFNNKSHCYIYSAGESSVRIKRQKDIPLYPLPFGNQHSHLSFCHHPDLSHFEKDSRERIGNAIARFWQQEFNWDISPSVSYLFHRYCKTKGVSSDALYVESEQIKYYQWLESLTLKDIKKEYATFSAYKPEHNVFNTTFTHKTQNFFTQARDTFDNAYCIGPMMPGTSRLCQ